MHRIRYLREKRGWTQQHLADAASLSRKTIVRLEKGELVPSKETLLAVAAAFDVELADLQDPQREWQEFQQAGAELEERLTTHHESFEDFRAEVLKVRASAPATEVQFQEGDAAPEIREEQHLWLAETTSHDDIRARRLRFHDELTGRSFTITTGCLRDEPEEVRAWFKTPKDREQLAFALGHGGSLDPEKRKEHEEFWAALSDAFSAP